MIVIADDNSTVRAIFVEHKERVDGELVSTDPPEQQWEASRADVPKSDLPAGYLDAFSDDRLAMPDPAAHEVVVR